MDTEFPEEPCDEVRLGDCLEMATPLRQRYGIIRDYDPDTVVEFMASLWAFPATPDDARKIMEADPAVITYCFPSPKVREVPARLRCVKTWEFREIDLMTHCHSCDILFYPHHVPPSYNRRRYLLEMLNYDRCFLSLDLLSREGYQNYKQHGSYDGLFIVHQLRNGPFPVWSKNVWRNLGCEARPHEE